MRDVRQTEAQREARNKYLFQQTSSVAKTRMYQKIILKK